jgi:hypothetical protein
MYIIFALNLITQVQFQKYNNYCWVLVIFTY